MKRIKSALSMFLLLLYILQVSCGSRGEEPSLPVSIFMQVEQQGTAIAVPTATHAAKRLTSTILKPTIVASPTPTATETFSLPKGRFLVTAQTGAEGQNASFVRYYDKNNQKLRELTIPRSVFEVSTSGDGHFLAYYGDGDLLIPYDGIYIYDTATGQEWELEDYQNCTGPADWSPQPYRLAISCRDIMIISYINNQWIEEGIIPLPDEYDQMPAELRPLLVAPAWSPDGKSIAYILDHSLNHPGAAAGPYLTDVTCISAPRNCQAKTKAFNESVSPSPTSVLSWSVDGASFYIANGKAGDIIAVGTVDGKSNRILDTDEQIYHMVWTEDQTCFWFSRNIGSFRQQSIYKYCLGDDAAEEEIRGGGYLVGIVNNNGDQ